MNNFNQISICRCKCRHAMRFLKRQNESNEISTNKYIHYINSIIISLFSKLDIDIILGLIKMYYKMGEPLLHYPINKKKVLIDNVIEKYRKRTNNISFCQILNEYITYENAEILFELYNNCECCSRHQVNKPEFLKKPKINIELLFNRLEN